jgi:hypothetical protein
MANENLAGMKVDELTKLYIQLRDALDEQTRAYKELKARVEAAQLEIEVELMRKLEALGVTNFKCEHGTAFKTTKTTASMADWDAFMQFVRDGEHYEFLNHSVNKTAVADYMEANDGEIPPGVNWRAEQVVQVRRG